MNEDLDPVITVLKERRSKLEEIRDLKAEISRLEAENMAGTQSSIIIRTICELICEVRGMNFESLFSDTQAHCIAHPRQEVWFLCRDVRGLKFHEIGRAFGMDHTNIMHGVKAVRNRIETDRDFSKFIDQLKERCVAKLKEKNGQISQNSA